jgi:regulator of protease activity HflC (stomatin/prohibitin superfamily)
VTVVPDALEATLDVLESRLRTKVTQGDIWSLVGLRTSLPADFRAAASEVTAIWGVEVVDVKLLEIEASSTRTCCAACIACRPRL